jgi:hypothetical protein
MAKRFKKRAPKVESKWRMRERVSALIEATLDPDATIEQPRWNGEGSYRFSMTFRPRVDGRLAPHMINVLGLEAGEVFSAGYGAENIGPFVVSLS